MPPDAPLTQHRNLAKDVLDLSYRLGSWRGSFAWNARYAMNSKPDVLIAGDMFHDGDNDLRGVIWKRRQESWEEVALGSSNRKRDRERSKAASRVRVVLW